MAEFLHFVFFTAEGIFVSCTAFRAEEHEVVNRKILFVEHAEKLLAHGAAGANNSYVHRFL